MFLAEFLATLLFVNVFINITYTNHSQDLILNGALLGLSLAHAMFIAEPLSGGSLNPAIGLVLPIFDSLGTPLPNNKHFKIGSIQ